MHRSAQGAPEVDAFDDAREELEATIAELRGRGACPATEVIAALRRRGAEVQRRLLQTWMGRLFELERAETALWPRPAGSEVRVRARRLETDFGRITVKRHGYKLEREPSAAFPMDGVLNLPEAIYALSLRRRVAEQAVGESFDAAVDSVDRTTSGHVPKRQSEELVVRAARDFDAFYETRPQAANDTLGPPCVAGDVVRQQGSDDAPRGVARRHAQGGRGRQDAGRTRRPDGRTKTPTP